MSASEADQAEPQSRYTRYDLQSCEVVAERVLEHGGTISHMALAAVLGYKSANNGAYMQRLAGTRLFGLIEGQGQSIRATDRARDILQPRVPADLVRARLAAFRDVPLFDDFFSRHEGRPLLGPEGAAREIQNTYQLPAEKAKLAYARMMSSARLAGLFSINEHMMITPTIHEAPEPAPAPEPAQRTPEPPTGAMYGGEGSDTYPLFVVAALAEVPWNGTEGEWTEDDLREWMEWFERGVRVHLRMSRARRSASPVTPSEVGQS